MCRISFTYKAAKALLNPGALYTPLWQKWMNLPRHGWVKTHRIEDVRILASNHARVGPGHRTHIEDEGERCCLANTRVVMLHHGRIIFEGPAELFWKSNEPVIREFVEYDTVPQ